jgi:uncharacterized membrane protein
MSTATGRPIRPVYRLGLIAWALLTALQLVWHAWLKPPHDMPIALLLAITVIPLLLPLLALRDARRALLWVGILSLFYFCHGVSEAWSSAGERWLAIAEIVLTVVLIGALGAGVQRRKDHAKIPPSH